MDMNVSMTHASDRYVGGKKMSWVNKPKQSKAVDQPVLQALLLFEKLSSLITVEHMELCLNGHGHRRGRGMAGTWQGKAGMS